MDKASNVYRLELELAHPAETVWAALTRKALVDKYYLAPLHADVGGAGSEIAYGPPKIKMITGVVVAHDAPRKLAHTFRFDGDTESPDTTVTYTLTRTAKGTKLEIRHEGYPEISQGRSNIEGGWPIIADRLKAMLDAQR